MATPNPSAPGPYGPVPSRFALDYKMVHAGVRPWGAFPPPPVGHDPYWARAFGGGMPLPPPLPFWPPFPLPNSASHWPPYPTVPGAPPQPPYFVGTQPDGMSVALPPHAGLSLVVPEQPLLRVPPGFPPQLHSDCFSEIASFYPYDGQGPPPTCEGETPFRIFFGQIRAGVSLEILANLVRQLTSVRIVVMRFSDAKQHTAMGYVSNEEDQFTVCARLHGHVVFDTDGAWVAQGAATESIFRQYAPHRYDPVGPKKALVVEGQMRRAPMHRRRGARGAN